MTTFAITNQFRSYAVKAVVHAMAIHHDNVYLMGFKGVAYPGTDTVPDDLVTTESATISDVVNPLFFKKINLNGVHSSVKYVVPDDVNGTITMYTQRYREVSEADLLTENVRHFIISVEIPKNDILITDTIRGFGIVADLVESGGSLASGDSYLAAQVDLAASLSVPTNFLLYLENVETYSRVATKAGEHVRALFAL